MEDTQTDVHKNGQVKWFNKKAGYGFICVIDEPDKDVFVHHSALQTESDIFRYLVEGEYVKFTIKSGETNAVDVTGAGGGKLMCETRQMRRTAYESDGARCSKSGHETAPRIQRKQVYVAGDIDDGCVWELVRRAPKANAPVPSRTPGRKGPRIVTEK